MANNDQLIPGKTEVKEQLRTILSNKLFLKHKKPSDVLKWVVSAVLNGAEHLDTKDVVRGVFDAPHYGNPEGSAKFNASKMRALVKKYYETDGQHDPVKIRFREDDNENKKKYANYMPSFEYSPEHKEVRWYKEGLNFLHKANPQVLDMASLALFLHPWPEAQQAYIETLMAGEMFHSVITLRPNLAQADFALEKIFSSSSDHWRTHAVAGAVALLRKQIEKASHHFQIALQQNKEDTKHYGWYHAFLFAVGRSAEALDLVRKSLIAQPMDATTQALGGLWLYGLRLFDEAEKAFHNAWVADTHCFLGRLGSIFNDVALGRPDFAVEAIELLVNTPVQRRYIWGIAELVSALTAKEAKRAGQPEIYSALTKPLSDEIDIQGLYNKDEYVGDERWAALQIAILCLAKEDYARAIEKIDLAWANAEPFTIWLHMLPIFDPLLKYDKFQALLQKRLQPPPEPSNVR